MHEPRSPGHTARSVSVLLRATVEARESAIEQLTARVAGRSLPSGRADLVLALVGGPLSVTELARTIGRSQQRVSVIAADLVTTGLLRRGRHGADGRVTTLALDLAGQRWAAARLLAERFVDARVREEFADGNDRSFEDLLRRLETALRRLARTRSDLTMNKGVHCERTTKD